MKNKEKFKKIINIILLIITVGILVYFCISNNNLVTLINSMHSVNYMWFGLAILSMILVWYFDSSVIYMIMRSICNGSYSRSLSFRFTMTGQYFSAITPLGVGGQPMQVVEMNNHGIEAGKSISVLVRKFLIYQTSMVLYSLMVIIMKSGLFISKVPGFVPLSLIGFASQCSIVVVLLMFYINKGFTTKIIKLLCKILSKIKIIKDANKLSKSIENQLNFFVENNKQMRGNRKLTFKLYSFVFLQLTCLFSVPFLIYKSFNNPGFPIIDMISAQSFVTMISSYTPLPGAAGTTEGTFILLFKDFFGENFITPAMLLCRLVTYYFSIIFSFTLIKTGFGKNKKKK